MSAISLLEGTVKIDRGVKVSTRFLKVLHSILYRSLEPALGCAGLHCR